MMSASWVSRSATRLESARTWRTKVVKHHANIHIELLSLQLDGTTTIADYEARFDDVVAGHRKLMHEVAVLDSTVIGSPARARRITPRDATHGSPGSSCITASSAPATLRGGGCGDPAHVMFTRRLMR
jgi:hypothetical protein